MTRKPLATEVTERVGAPQDGDFGWYPIDRVHAWVKNPRRNAGAVATVKASILRFKWGRPLIANCRAGVDGELIVGHTAWLAAQELLKTKKNTGNWAKAQAAMARGIPIFWRDMVPEEAHALAIADNRTGEESEWDNDLLGELFQNEAFDTAAVFAMGFSGDELERFVKGKPEKGKRNTKAQLGEGLKFSVVVSVDDEAAQTELIERLELEGFACKPLMGAA